MHVKAVSDFSAISHMSIVSFKFAHFSTKRKETSRKLSISAVYINTRI